MMASRGRAAAARFLVLPVLVLLLVLGHACELSTTYATLAGSPLSTDSFGHSGDDHDGGPGISCDPVGAVSSPGQPHVGSGPAISMALGSDHPAPGWPAADSARHSASRAAPAPLFLLHASFLI